MNSKKLIKENKANREIVRHALKHDSGDNPIDTLLDNDQLLYVEGRYLFCNKEVLINGESGNGVEYSNETGVVTDVNVSSNGELLYTIKTKTFGSDVFLDNVLELI